MSWSVNPVVAADVERIAAAPLPWDAFSGATVLITGASGFLPAYLVQTLLHLNRTRLARPCRVVALVRNAERGRARFSAYLDGPDLELLVQDVCDPLPAFPRLDYIIHAASQASPRYYRVDPAGTLLPNVMGTHRLLTAAQSHDLKGFLFFSGGEVYGTTSKLSGVNTEKDYGSLDPTEVRSCYGESKRMGETMCVAWAHQYGIPTRIARAFHTYGPGMRMDDGRVYADFVRDILSGGPIVLHSDGSARRCFCYLADATEAFFTVLLKGATGEAYNVANVDAECSISELADRLAVQFSASGLTVERRVRMDQNYMPSPIQYISPSIEKVKQLGWFPRLTIEEGFARTVQSYQSEPDFSPALSHAKGMV